MAGLVTLRVLCAREMLNCAQGRCLCPFRSLHGPWEQRTIVPFSVSQSLSSAVPSRDVLSGRCLWKVATRPRHCTFVVRGFSIQKKQVRDGFLGQLWGWGVRNKGPVKYTDVPKA